jgi:2-amino-4-hydroxy-6-hydroxymethyldihydropteridine diphosphokinase
MALVLVSIGSNLGDRCGFLQRAVNLLAETPGLRLRSVSSVYETEPVGKKDQPQFFNAGIGIESLLSPDSLLVNLKHIEGVVGRRPSERWGPREIDLDLIYVGALVSKSPLLTLPHPEAAGRRFVLTPLAEIAPDFVDPLRHRTLRELLSDCPDRCTVAKTALAIHFSAEEH